MQPLQFSTTNCEMIEAISSAATFKSFLTIAFGDDRERVPYCQYR
jgi:hypothetical protein